MTTIDIFIMAGSNIFSTIWNWLKISTYSVKSELTSLCGGKSSANVDTVTLNNDNSKDDGSDESIGGLQEIQSTSSDSNSFVGINQLIDDSEKEGVVEFSSDETSTVQELEFLENFFTNYLNYFISGVYDVDENSEVVLVSDDYGFISNDWLNIIFDFYIVGLYVVAISIYLLVTASKIIINMLGGRDNFIAMYSHFEDWEEELGSLDDVIVYILIMATSILWFYFFTIVSSYIVVKSLSWLVSLFFFLLLNSIIIPSSVLKNMGLYFAQYVRGSSRSTNIIFEIILDILSVLTLIVRFFIQNIRFVMVFFSFFDLYEFIYFNIDIVSLKLLYNFNTFSPLQQNNIYMNWSYIEIVLQIFVQIVMYIFYLGHLTVLFLMQLSIYFMLSFWLFFFLYTTFLLNPEEKYFFIKRVFNV